MQLRAANHASLTRLRRLRALACALLAWLAADRVQADALQVLLLGAPDAEIAARVRGQTRDLPLLLEVAEPPAPLDRAAAEQLGREHAAQVVVWSEPRDSAGLRVFVLDIESGELRERDVAAPTREALAASTTAEIAALVVRSELTGLIAERDAALARAAAPAPPQPAPSPPEPIRRAPPAPAPAPPPPRAPGPWLLGAGYRISRPLAGEPSHAGALALRRDIGRFAVGVDGYAARALELASGDTEARLRRFGFRLAALWGARPSAHTRVWLGAAAGCAATVRHTQALGDQQRATKDRLTWAGVLGPFGELHWQPVPALGLSLSIGVDIVLGRTKFTYEDAGQEQPLGALEHLDPWAIAGVFTRFGK
jgi:hypothetical protein